MRKGILAIALLPLFSATLRAQSLPTLRAFGAYGLSSNSDTVFHGGVDTTVPFLALLGPVVKDKSMFLSMEIGYAQMSEQKSVIFSPLNVTVPLPPLHNKEWQPFLSGGPALAFGGGALAFGGGLNYWFRGGNRGMTFEFKNYAIKRDQFYEFRAGFALR
jgi:hypothetical protein